VQCAKALAAIPHNYPNTAYMKAFAFIFPGQGSQSVGMLALGVITPQSSKRLKKLLVHWAKTWAS
jgi:hypothetical protein